MADIMTMYQIVRHLENYGNVAINEKILKYDETQRFIQKNNLLVKHFDSGTVVLEVTGYLNYSDDWYKAKEVEDRLDKYKLEKTRRSKKQEGE